MERAIEGKGGAGRRKPTAVRSDDIREEGAARLAREGGKVRPSAASLAAAFLRREACFESWGDPSACGFPEFTNAFLRFLFPIFHAESVT